MQATDAELITPPCRRQHRGGSPLLPSPYRAGLLSAGSFEGSSSFSIVTFRITTILLYNPSHLEGRNVIVSPEHDLPPPSLAPLLLVHFSTPNHRHRQLCHHHHVCRIKLRGQDLLRCAQFPPATVISNGQ